MRSIQVNIDRPNFMINPTNCSAFTVDSQGIGDQGTIADFCSLLQRGQLLDDAVQAENDGPPGRRPRKGTQRASNPQLGSTCDTRGRRQHQVPLGDPAESVQIDQSHLGNICSEKELVEKQCAGRTRDRHGNTSTPLLDQPLSGPAYAVSGSGGLPRLAFVLNGQVNLIPRADTKSVEGRLRTTVPVVPDAADWTLPAEPLRRQDRLSGQHPRPLQSKPTMRVEYIGQNGKALKSKVKVKVPCRKSK